jgi:hypothetical protein
MFAVGGCERSATTSERLVAERLSIPRLTGLERFMAEIRRRRFRAMELITILNRCHTFIPPFVSECQTGSRSVFMYGSTHSRRRREVEQITELSVCRKRDKQRQSGRPG